MARPFDLSRTFVHLSNGGATDLIELTPSFWRASSRGRRYDRVIGVFEFRSSKDLHSRMQEVHPEADELLYVIAGALDAVLEENGAERTVALDAGQATIVPQGVWHRLVMRKPGKLLFVNNRIGIRGRTARTTLPPPARAGRPEKERRRRRPARAARRR